MKLQKLLKRMYKHKYGTGTTFYLKDDNIIDTRYIVEYKYEEEIDTHSLYLLEHEMKNGRMVQTDRRELGSSRFLNSDIRFYLKDFVKPQLMYKGQ